MCTRSEKADFMIVWSYQKRLSEKSYQKKAFSDPIRSGFLVPYQKSRFLISFSNSIRSGLTLGLGSDGCRRESTNSLIVMGVDY